MAHAYSHLYQNLLWDWKSLLISIKNITVILQSVKDSYCHRANQKFILQG